MSRDTITFDAQLLARGWLSVAVASGKDPGRPFLDRTVAVEVFDGGVRLVATDSYLLLYAWVPALGKEGEDGPDLEERPHATYIAIDDDKRAQGLMAYLLGLATAKDAPLYEVQVEGGRIDDEGAMPGMARQVVVIDHLGSERLVLRTVEGEWVTWQALVHGHKAVRTETIALHPDRLGALAKLVKLRPGVPIEWSFGGVNKAAHIRIDGLVLGPPVAGIVMPVRMGDEEPVDGAVIHRLVDKVAPTCRESRPDVTATVSHGS